MTKMEKYIRKELNKICPKTIKILTKDKVGKDILKNLILAFEQIIIFSKTTNEQTKS